MISGRLGPVVFSLPEDLLIEVGTANHTQPWRQIETSAGSSEMRELREFLAAAERSFAIVASSQWTSAACDPFAEFACDNNIPVAASFRRQLLFSAEHPCFAGEVGVGINPGLKALVQQSDLLLLVGGRLANCLRRATASLMCRNRRKGSRMSIPEPRK